MRGRWPVGQPHLDGQEVAVTVEVLGILVGRPVVGPVLGGVDDGEPVAARLATIDVQGPFFETLSTCVERRTALPADRSPLRAAVGGVGRTVLLTDDANRRELREAVEAAQYRSSQVVVFLAPRVLFELDALGDLSAAYERYVAFEPFRRSLDGVSVFEVNPGNRSRRLRSETTERSA